MNWNLVVIKTMTPMTQKSSLMTTFDFTLKFVAGFTTLIDLKIVYAIFTFLNHFFVIN